MTTDPAGTTPPEASSVPPPATGDRAERRRAVVSVRVRLIATVAVLAALALAGAGAVVFLIESQRIEQQVAAEVEQEFAELAQFQRNGVDPLTGEAFAGVAQLLDAFLSRNVPDDSELLVAWYDDGPRTYLPRRREALAESPAFAEAVAPLLAGNGSTTLSTASGEVRIDVQGVRLAGTGESGALVVVTFLDEARAGLVDTMRTYTVVAVLFLAVVLGAAAWQSARLLDPLRVLRETAESIGEGDLSHRIPERGNDDLTALTRTFNTMLGRLESAFADQRRFLDDAGHELKTPLTVLRGHLEVLEATDPEDVAETRALLLDEIDRMSRLVGDLILLAKSQRPDFLAPSPVDLAQLTAAVHAKASGLAERTWVLDESASGAAVLDEQRLTQALLQLADNAVKHTTRGHTVGIGSRVDGTSLTWWVRDTGRGVPEADRERVFERFGRSTVPRGDEGFGLGLSIVRAIAEAHGGTAHVEGVEPTGARFVVTLPLVRPADGPGPPRGAGAAPYPDEGTDEGTDAGPDDTTRDLSPTRTRHEQPYRPDREEPAWPAS